MVRRPLLNLANALTLSRFAAAPFMVLLILAMRAPGDPAPEGACPAWILSLAALALLVVTLLTDLFDGMVARRLKVVTDFGKIMDPVADSTFFMTLMFALSAAPRFRDDFPIWLPLIVLYREVAMQVMRRYGALRGKVMAAKWSGKIKMAAQSVAMAAFFLLATLSDRAALFGAAWLDEAALRSVLFWVGAGVAALNVLSLVEYMKDVPSLVAEYQEPGDA